MTCHLAKSRICTFSLVEYHTVSPYELMHLDVRQSPVLSRKGFNYYVLFIDDFSHFTWISPMKQNQKSTIFLQFQDPS